MSARRMKRHHELPFGAEIVEGGVRFRLWAPKFEEISVAIENGPELPMEAQDGGWFTLTTDAARAGTRYRYRAGDLLVPDPASRHQPNDVHGPSEVIDPRSYEWRDEGWRGRPWEETVLYELHTGTFSSSGDFAGVGRHLDHLADLGVTAIELLPVNDFPGRRNWGYDGTLLFAPDAAYGRPEDLKRLVEACHARGLSLFLDVVYNHFGPDGNYLGHYANFFTTRHQTPWGDGINFDGRSSRAVRDFFIHNALYWLEEFNVDGLRFDAVHAILDDSEPDIVTEIAAAVRRALPERPVHLVLENDHNTARYLERRDGRPVHHTAQWNDDVHHALRVAMTGTSTGYYMDYADVPAERLGRALAEGFTYQGEPSAYRDGARRGEASAHLPPTAFVSFIQNHDQVGNNAFGNRLATLASPEAMHAGAAIVLLSPQIPMLFMGEEWAADQPFLYFVDMGPELGAAIREGRRREFAKFAEFADEKARERIPDPNAETSWRRSVLDWSVLDKEPHGTWLARYRELIALRRHEIVPRLRGVSGSNGQYRVLGERALRVDWRLGDGATLRLIANFGSSVIEAERAGRQLYATAEPGAPMSAAFFLA
jgi:maltooligosyltrehalose trehalohydrolase